VLTVDVLDEADPILAYLAAEYPNLISKAAKSTGYMMQKQIKAGILSGAPGGVPYAPLIPPPFRPRLDELTSGHTKPDYKLLGALAQATGYQYKDGVLLVGWLSDSAVKIGVMEEEGAVKPFNTQMRQQFLEAGLHPSKNKTEVVIPKRATYAPMFRILAPQITPYIAEKLDEYETKGLPDVTKNKRKYSVKG
jgi:hypothetical protein